MYCLRYLARSIFTTSVRVTVAHEMASQLSKNTPDQLILIDGWAHFDENLANKQCFAEMFSEAYVSTSQI